MTCATERRAIRRLSSVAVVVVVLTALSACFPSTPIPSDPATGVALPIRVTPLAPLAVPRVISYCPAEDAVHYQGYWLAIDKVYICRADGSRATDGISTYGPWETVYLIEHPAALLTAYRMPDAVTSLQPCAQYRSDPLIVWVRHDGVTTAYYAPVDACGHPSFRATDAYQKAKRTLVVEVDRGAMSR